MKTPKCEYEIIDEDIPRLLEDIYQNIILIYKNKEKVFKYLWDEDKIIEIKKDIDSFTFGFFYYLDILLTDEDNKEVINFIYDFDFIKKAYNFLVKRTKNKVRQIIGIKIIDDLIYNYRNTVDEDKYSSFEPKIDKIKSNIQIIYENSFTRYLEEIEEFDLPRELEEINIEDIYSKKIIGLFKNPKFEDFEKIYNLSRTFEIDSNYIDENILSEVKNIINSNEFENEFLLTKEDFYTLDKNRIKDEKALAKKINLLYFLMVHILNDPSNFEDFSFLLKTNILLDEILHETDSDKLLSRVDKGIKNRFSKILEIFDDNKTLFSTKISTTLSQNFTEEKYIIKKSKTKKIKNNNKIFTKKVYISNHFGIIINQSNYIYDIEALKLFESINSSEKIDNNQLISHEINCVSEKGKRNKKYNYIFNLINNFKYIPQEFINNIDFKAIFKKENDIITIAIRCEDIVHSFSFEYMDSISQKIQQSLNFITIY